MRGLSSAIEVIALIGSWVPPHAPHIGSSSYFERLLVLCTRYNIVLIILTST